MAMSVIRFDMRAPDHSPEETRALYDAAVEMAAWADEQAFDMLVLSEHHAAEDGFLPSPLVLGAAMAARTSRIPMNVAALLVPLHDPIRLAEDLAVLDLISGGRISFVAGLGYRPVEYALHDQEWKRRGRRLEESLQTMVTAWTGEPFEHNGETVVVRPRPFQQPHPMVLIGGSSAKSAERAARFGFGFFPSTGDQGLADAYVEACAREGRDPGFIALPKGPGVLFVSEDPERTWAEIGPALVRDAVTYAAWQQPDMRSAMHSHAHDVEGLKAEGIYSVVTPDECVALADELGPLGALTFHPLCGGLDPDRGWESLELFASAVLPRLRAGTEAP